MTPTERKALDAFAAAVRVHYGTRLRGVYHVNVIEYGHANEESDTDVVLVIEDGDWQLLTEKERLSELTLNALMDHGIYIGVWPLTASAWANPESARDPEFVRELQRKAVPMERAA